MKRITIAVAGILLANYACSQGLNGLINKAASNPDSMLNRVMQGGTGTLSEKEIAAGLKEALQVGTRNTTRLLGAKDGFLGNNAVKILLPPETHKVQQTMSKLGLSSLSENLITSMNRAAEDAAAGVGEIFADAITKMTIADAVGILKGDDFAATNFLKRTTSPQLKERMRPVIESSLNKVNATGYWNAFFTQYNRFTSKKINPDLVDYVSTGTLNGLFYQLGQEEKSIRKDPAARATDLLKKVFGN
jgi:hypothetical protein